MMYCEEDNINLLGFIDGDLSDEEHNLVQQHLNYCLDCQAKLEWLKETYQIIEHENQLEFNPFFYAKLEQRLRSKTTTSSIAMWTNTVLKPIGIAASILIGVYLGNVEVFETNVTELAESEVELELLTPEYSDLLIAFNE